MYWDVLDSLCLRIHLNLYAIWTFIPLFSMGQYFGVFLQAVFNVFWLQKRAVRIINGSGPLDSCRGLFKKLRLQPLWSQYILCLSLFVVDNRNLFHVNSEIHSFDTKQNSNHQLQANLSLYQKGTYYAGVKFLIVSPPL